MVYNTLLDVSCALAYVGLVVTKLGLQDHFGSGGGFSPWTFLPQPKWQADVRRNFDIIFGHISVQFLTQFYSTPHVSCDMLCLLPMRLIEC